MIDRNDWTKEQLRDNLAVILDRPTKLDAITLAEHIHFVDKCYSRNQDKALRMIAYTKGNINALE